MVFESKDDDKLRQEIVEDLRGDNEDFNEEENEDTINRILKRRKKDEDMKTSLWKGKDKQKKKANDMEKGKNFYKGKKKVSKDTEKKPTISAEDKSYLYGKLDMTRTEVRHLEKVMKSTSKNWEDALKDNLYTTFKKENDKLIKRRGSQLDTGSGGQGQKEKTQHDELVKEFSATNPKGFSRKPKK